MKPDDFHQHIDSIKTFLTEQLSQMRAGRASAALVDGIMVEAYEGSDALPVNEVASISVPEPQSILITPWDKSIIDKIEVAVAKSGKGLNPVNDGENIRVPVPTLTEEKRKEMVKDISAAVEQAKIRVRTLRQDVMKSIEEQETNGVISEDDMHRQKKDVEEDIAKVNKELEDMGSQKESEIMTI